MLMPNPTTSSKGTAPGVGKRSNPFYQAQAILSRRDHAEAEVRRKLQQKGFVPSQIDTVVTWLKEHKLIDDESFARMYVESLLRSKPVGQRWLTAKLRQRGVDGAIVDRVLADAFAGEREKELVREAARARSFPLDRSGQQRLQRFLLARGFSMQVVSDYVSSLRRGS